MSQAKPLYQPWNEDEFQSSIPVRGMSCLQRWMYRSLLQSAFFHATRPYLPSDDESLRVLSGCDSAQQWLENKAVILKCFTLRDDGLLENTRITADWERLQLARERMTALGKKSAAVRRTFNAGSTEVEQELKVSRTEVEQRKVKEVKEGEERNTATPVPETSNTEGEEMASAHRKIEDYSRSILGVRERLDFGSPARSDINSLVRLHGSDTVAEAFREWAEQNRGNQFNGRPVSAFLRVADGLLSGQTVLHPTGETEEALRAIRRKAGSDVVFNPAQMALVNRLVEKYGKDDFLLGFDAFYAKIAGDDFLIRRSGKDFSDTAEQYILPVVEAREEARRNEETARRLTEDARAQIVRETESRRAARESEETVPDDDPFADVDSRNESK